MFRIHLGTLEEIKVTTTAELWEIPIQAYEACFANWKSHWHHCVGAERNYFEGDDVLSDEL